MQHRVWFMLQQTTELFVIWLLCLCLVWLFVDLCVGWSQAFKHSSSVFSDLVSDLGSAVGILIQVSANRLNPNKYCTIVWFMPQQIHNTELFVVGQTPLIGAFGFDRDICAHLKVMSFADWNYVILQCWIQCNMFLSNPLDGLKTTSRICNSPNIESYCAIKTK